MQLFLSAAFNEDGLPKTTEAAVSDDRSAAIDVVRNSDKLSRVPT